MRLDDAPIPLVEVNHAVLGGRLVGAGLTDALLVERLAALVHAVADIVVLDGGRIVDQGTHEQLLARPGLYRRLHDLQFTDTPD